MSQSAPVSLDVRVAMNTDIGRKRKQNQDAIGHHVPADADQLDQLGQVFVLADGVGGLAGGDLASQYAVSTIISSYYEQTEGEPADRLARAIAEANHLIYAEGHGDETARMMATTVVAAVVRGRDLIIGAVGDSPAYLVRSTSIRKLTLDHTVSEMQRAAGTPLREGDPNGRKLVRALGGQPSVKVDIISGRVRSGDHVVLCSDGLTRYVTPEEIETTVSTLGPDEAVGDLIRLANERGGADNISVIVLRLQDDAFSAPVGTISDPMVDWGLPRKPVRAREKPEPVPSAADTQVVSRSAPELPAAEVVPNARPAAESPWLDVWRLLRGNTTLTIAGMGLALVLFVGIMLVIVNTGDDDSGLTSAGLAATTESPATEQTATAALGATATAQERAVRTNEALQVAEAATAAAQAIQALTPATPVPTSGPQMESGTWFQVLDGDPVLTYTSPDTGSDPAAPLEPGSNYRVTMVNRAPAEGPWYQVIDNQGLEARWVNGRSLHQRIVAVNTAGEPLPDDEQPLDVPPPDAPQPTAPPTPATSDADTSAEPGTPADSASQADEATPVVTVSPTPTIAYGVETWALNTTVVLKADLELCGAPTVEACRGNGDALANETGQVVAGPVANGEHWWWQVEFPDGRIGWVAQVLLGVP